MELFFIVLGLIILFFMWRLFPDWFAARCPICYARFDSIDELDEIRHYQDWHLVWHNFYCPSCGYRWRRIEISKSTKLSKA